VTEFPLPNIIDFLTEVFPFNSLDRQGLAKIAPQIEIAFYPRGRLIIQKGARNSGFLHIIQAGAARVSIPNDAGSELLVDIRGRGGIPPAPSVFS
jgi:signal-transduction protein with cAMP-binding, CBS, and nucleotidyltransferase domain